MKLLIFIITLFSVGNVKAQIAPFYSNVNDKYGYQDEKGNVVIEPKYDLAYPLEEGMSAVRINGKYGYINQNGKEIVTPKYDNTWKFIGGFAAVKLDNKFGFIDKNGKTVVPLIYQNAYNYHGTCCYKGQAHVKENGKWKIIKINTTD